MSDFFSGSIGTGFLISSNVIVGCYCCFGEAVATIAVCGKLKLSQATKMVCLQYNLRKFGFHMYGGFRVDLFDW